jgi:hypothetical protein
VCPGNTASYLATLLLIPVLDVQGRNLSSYQVSSPFVNSYMDQDFPGILQNKADVLACYNLEVGLFQSGVGVQC